MATISLPARSMTAKLLRLIRVYGLLALAVVVFALMVRDGINDPGPSGLEGDLVNRHNHPGALLTWGLWLAGEVAVLYLVLRPWSYRRSWGRALLALVLCAPPLLLALLVLIHSGGIMAWHAMWLLAVFVTLLTCLVVSSAGAWTHRRRGPASGPGHDTIPPVDPATDAPVSAAPVEFAYELTPALSRAATRRFFQHQLGWRVPLALVGYAAACGMMVMIGATLLTGVFIGAGVLLVVLAVLAYFVRTRRNAGLLGQVADRSALCRVTDEGIELHNELGHSTFPWRMVRKVVRYPDVWLLFIGPQPFWLPAAPLAAAAGDHILDRSSRAGAKVV
jgi:hypothetical protein